MKIEINNNEIKIKTMILGGSDSVVIYDFVSGTLPLPYDVFFGTDGTLNLPVPDANDYKNPLVAMNSLDGWSNTSRITCNLNKSVDPNTIADSIKVFATNNNLLSNDHTINKQLVINIDYLLIPLDTTIVIMPKNPLAPKTTYFIVITNSLMDIDGNAFVKDEAYNIITSTDQLMEGTPYYFLENIRSETVQYLNATSEFLQDGGNIINTNVASWMLTTQSTSDILLSLANDNIVNETIVMGSTNINEIFPILTKSEIYTGSLEIPYYLATPDDQNPYSYLTDFWTGENGSFLTQFNVKPVTTERIRIPVLLTVPIETDEITKPPDGWPIVIFQHGLTGDRTNLLPVADTFSSIGYAVIGIEHPLHGIVENNPLYDLLNGTIPPVDGAVSERYFPGQDPKDSSNYFNLQYLLTARDNLRQSVSDLLQLRHGLHSLVNSSDGNTLINSNNVSYIGHSLGAIVGGVFTKITDMSPTENDDLESAVFAMGATQLANSIVESASFGPGIAGFLEITGASVEQFTLVSQTVLDSADPVNYVKDILAPSLMIEVVGGGVNLPDQVLPPTVISSPYMAGTEGWNTLQTLENINISAEGPWFPTNQKGVLKFIAGDHVSIIDATSSTLATITMQEAVASFILSKGNFVNVSDTSTLLPFGTSPVYDAVALFTGIFGNIIYNTDDSSYLFPSWAPSWAGVANVNYSIYPLTFSNSGKITFNYDASNGDVDIRFRFERLPFDENDPNATEPSYNTEVFSCSGTGIGEVTIPSQGTNTFSSLILYLDTRDVSIILTDFIVYSDGSETEPEPEPGSIPVFKGWNLISSPIEGSLSETNVVANTLYGYNTNGYFNSELLEVGRGYWVKCINDGVININN